MGSACIINVNNRGELLVEYLKTSGRIENYYWGNGPEICFDFSGTFTLTFDDYVEIHPQGFVIRNRENSGMASIAREDFFRFFQSHIIKTLSGAEVVEFVPREKIILRDTEKTRVVAFRITEEEGKKLESIAKELGVTMSDLLRSYIKEKLDSVNRQK